jgi:hypothetical protein
VIKIVTKNKTFYPNTTTQTNQSNERQFSNLNNIKKYADYAQSSSLIAGKTGTHNKPSKLTATHFNINLPTGSEITSIKVEYAHQKVSYQGGTPNIPAPTIDLANVSVAAKTGKTPTTTMKASSVTFTGTFTMSKVTSNSFGVVINYPKNVNTNPGYLRVKYIRVVVYYKEPSYSITLSRSGSNVKNDEVIINAVLSNKNTTSYNPNLNITLPSTVTYNGASGDGSITKNGSNLIWNPKLTSKTKSKTVSIRLQCKTVTSSTTVKFTEPTTSTSKSISFPILEEVTDGDDETDDTKSWNNEDSNYVRIFGPDHTQLYFDMYLTPENFETARANNGGDFFRWGRYANPTFSKNTFTPEDTCWNRGTRPFSSFDEDGHDETWWSITNQSNSTYVIWDGAEYTSNIILRVDISIYPSTITYPSCTILQLNTEELNRLGDGHAYKFQTYLKENTVDSFVRDWGKNFRIGVYNNPIPENQSIFIRIDDETGEKYTEIIDSTDYDTLNLEDILDHVETWSNVMTKVNEYENIEVDFTYDENYPLYLIITGDYPESANYAPVSFAEPCIIEESVYNSRERNGIFPTPILSTISPSEQFSTEVIPEYQTGNSIVAYELPLDDIDLTDTVVRGLSVSLDVEYTDQLILTCKLKNHNKITGERSCVVNPITENTVTFGDSTDKWGFTESQLTNFEDWEIEIQANNLFDNEQNQSSLLFNNITFTLYTTTLDTQTVKCLVEGENLAAYDAFITDIEIPAGLETDVKYLDVDGTDTNTAYRQNIKEKEIKLSFDIDACTIDEATQYLQDITQLLVNERDELNYPIPKRIEFSHYPGIYWEYILEKTIKAEPKVGSYECEATLTIPAGTAYTNDEITTGTTGKVNGIAKINPTIVIIPTNEHIEIEETITGQKFSMTYNEWSSSDTVEINTANRQVILNSDDEDNTNITPYVDYNADWFKIQGEYVFEPSGCIIQTISRIERR